MFAFTIHYIGNISNCIEFYVKQIVKGGTIIILYVDTSDEAMIQTINENSDGKYKFELDGDLVHVQLPFSKGQKYTENRISAE